MRKLTVKYPAANKGKRIESVFETLEQLGINPTTEMIRNAYKAEKAGQYGVAINGWEKIQSYVQHKMKAIDPAEQLEKQSKALSLAQLAQMKQAIYAGVVAEIKPETIIEQDPLDSLF